MDRFSSLLNLVHSQCFLYIYYKLFYNSSLIKYVKKGKTLLFQVKRGVFIHSHLFVLV
uniref:Uncharacterized protein n=1 Tax=Arundo donax TaxID=35708 RepID=A0A0A9B4T3_ARUDO